MIPVGNRKRECPDMIGNDTESDVDLFLLGIICRAAAPASSSGPASDALALPIAM